MKAHLADADSPLKEGSDVIANCGVIVKNVHFVFLWDNENFPEFLSVSMTRICRKCAHLELEKKYVYGIVCAQELLDAAREELEVAA